MLLALQMVPLLIHAFKNLYWLLRIYSVLKLNFVSALGAAVFILCPKVGTLVSVLRLASGTGWLLLQTPSNQLPNHASSGS